MIFSKSMIVMLSLAFSITSCAPTTARALPAKANPKLAKKVEKFTMVDADLLRCKVLSAKITMVAEDLFTRTAITEATIEKVGKTITLPTGDPRTAQLSQILSDTVLNEPTLDEFEPRLRLMLNCADGTSRKIIGSRMSSEGLLNLDIDGKNVSTLSPLREELEGLFSLTK
jgi:hypothetical protein